MAIARSRVCLCTALAHGRPLLTLWARVCLRKIADPLVCRRAHGFWLPPWADYSAAGNASFQFLAELQDWSMFEMFTGPTERRLTGGEWEACADVGEVTWLTLVACCA